MTNNYQPGDSPKPERLSAKTVSARTPVSASAIHSYIFTGDSNTVYLHDIATPEGMFDDELLAVLCASRAVTAAQASARTKW